MKISRLAAAMTLAVPLLLSACDSERARPTDGTPAERTVGSEVTGAIENARREMDRGNITISGDNAAKAEISPAGDLLIDGRRVEVTPAQRALLLEYRGHVMALASAGMDIGVQGAALAAKAMGEALRGVMTGDTENIEKRVEAQAAGVRDAALRLCDRLPAMLATQQKLAADLPQFKPYATMTVDSIDDCRRDAARERGLGNRPLDVDVPPPPTAPDAPPAPPAPDAPPRPDR